MICGRLHRANSQPRTPALGLIGAVVISVIVRIISFRLLRVCGCLASALAREQASDQRSQLRDLLLLLLEPIEQDLSSRIVRRGSSRAQLIAVRVIAIALGGGRRLLSMEVRVVSPHVAVFLEAGSGGSDERQLTLHPACTTHLDGGWAGLWLRPFSLCERHRARRRRTKKKAALGRRPFRILVEPWGIEPQTFAMPSRRSPS